MSSLAAGTTTPFSCNETNYNGSNCNSCTSGTHPTLEQYCVYCANDPGTTVVAGSKLSNPWGLKDVHGNVWGVSDRSSDRLHGNDNWHVPGGTRRHHGLHRAALPVGESAREPPELPLPRPGLPSSEDNLLIALCVCAFTL